MRKHSTFTAIAAGMIGVPMVLVAPAAAHHGWGSYSDEQFELEGTLVTAVSLAGPHATAQLKAGDEVWDLVFAPSARTARAGLTEDAVPTGAEVVASGHRHLDQQKLEVKVERLTWDGRLFNVYPDRN